MSDTERNTVDESIARLNIAFFQRRLCEETDEAKRVMIERLLAEEMAKLDSRSEPDRKYSG